MKMSDTERDFNNLNILSFILIFAFYGNVIEEKCAKINQAFFWHVHVGN